MMTRRLRLLLTVVGLAVALLITAFVLFNSSQIVTTRDEHFERIKTSGVLRVGMDASFPPFESMSDDGVVGFDADIARELARRMSLRVEFVTTGFDALYAQLTAGHFDVIISALPFERLRTRDVSYSDIYFRGGEVLLARADDLKRKTLADFNNQRIGVEIGTGAEVLAKKLERRNGYRTQSYTSLEDAARALESAEVQGVIADAVSARLLRREHPQIKIVGEPIGDEPNYVIAMPITSPQLLAAINRHLRAMEREGVLKLLIEKWF